MRFIRTLLFCLAIGIVIGALYGMADGGLVIKRYSYFESLSEQLVYLVRVIGIYSIFWMVISAFAFLVNYPLFEFFSFRAGFLNSFKNYGINITSFCISTVLYVHYIVWLNNRFLPTARELKSIYGNIVIIFLFLIIYLILVLLLGLFDSALKRAGFKRYLKKTYLSTLAVIFFLNSTIGLLLPLDKLANRKKEDSFAQLKNNKATFNIILITIDALRPDHLSCYGYKKSETPNIDLIAKNGFLFQNALSNAPWTFFSFSGLLTSRYPKSLTNCSMVPIPSSVPTLAQIVSQAGFKSCAIISNPHLSSDLNLTRGFENVFHMDEPYFISLIPYTKLHKFIVRLNVDLFLREDAKKLTNIAIEWLKRNRTKKFFLFIHYIDAHIPYGDPWSSEHLQRENYKGPIKAPFNEFMEVREGKLKLNEQDLDQIKYLYDADIAFVDKNIGRLFDFLKKNKLWENSLIILTADHGDEFYEHSGLNHGHSQYIELIRVPLLLKLPKSQEPKKIYEFVELIDLAPTILELANIPIPESFQGKSFAPLLKNETFEPKQFFFSECNEFEKPQRAIRDKRYTLIFFAKEKTIKLFDRSIDPFEQNDISKEHPELAKELFKKLKVHLRENSLKTTRKQKIIQLDKKRLKALGYVK